MQYKKSKRLYNQSGDTIVEVLIGIAILGLAIGTGYLLTNRSFLSGLSAAERVQAQAIAQGQAEFIKNAYLAGNISEYTNQTEDFCIPVSGGQPTTSASVCNNYGGSGSFFNVAIRSQPTVASNIFVIKTNWDSLGGGLNSTTIYYKVPN